MPGKLPGGCQVLVTGRSDGDLSYGAGRAGEDRRRGLVDLPWAVARQVHSNRVAVVGERWDPVEPVEADALVTTRTDQPVAVLGADCALVGLASAEGVIGVAHAGWRGLLAGVVEETVAVMRSLGAGPLSAVLGPCIHPECYAFGEDQLELVADRLGPSVRARTATGAAALDLPAGIRAALADAGVVELVGMGGCTACSPQWYSYRARREEERQALVLWRPVR